MSDASTPSLLRRVYVPFVGVAALVVALDQLTKDWAVERLGDGRPFSVLGPIEFRLASNQGMAFSLGENRGQLIGGLALVIVIGLAVFARTVHSRGAVILMGTIAGGALGNLGDRLFRAPHDSFLGGGVVDFIYTRFWPTFNVADSCVVVGGLLLAVWVYRTGDPEQAEASASGEPGDTGSPGEASATTTPEPAGE